MCKNFTAWENLHKWSKTLEQARSHTLEEELCKQSWNSYSSDALHPYNLICQQTKESYKLY